MPELRYLALDAQGVSQSVPLALDAQGEARLALSALPGSRGLHLEVWDGDEVHLRCEIPAADDETVEIGLGCLPGGGFTLDTGSRLGVVLPPDARHAPVLPIPVPAHGQPWDIAVVVDGTARVRDRSSRETEGRLLLADPEHWPAMAGQIATLVERLTRDSASANRVTVLAFGDEPLAGVSDPQLCPTYVLHRGLPGDGLGLTALGRVDLRRALMDLPATPGADFTDALADALHTCTRLHWRTQARRLVVLFGDSPGHALAVPVPQGGDARARRHDVDMEARRLHRAGVEILTVYQGQTWPTGGSGDLLTLQRREMLRHVADQYLRLASEARLAVTAEGFEPDALATTLLDRDYPLARGPCYGWAEPR